MLLNTNPSSLLRTLTAGKQQNIPCSGIQATGNSWNLTNVTTSIIRCHKNYWVKLAYIQIRRSPYRQVKAFGITFISCCFRSANGVATQTVSIEIISVNITSSFYVSKYNQAGNSPHSHAALCLRYGQWRNFLVELQLMIEYFQRKNYSENSILLQLHSVG